ncbi:MAG: hypothetical protein ABIP33_11265 [Pseudolysinimonas sp.]
MTIPKWLLPVIAIVAALAVGVAAVLVGMRFASTQVSATPGIQKSVPMIAPIAAGQKASSIVGSARISEPGTGDSGPVSPSQQALIDAVISSPDPGHTIDVITGGAPVDPGTPAGETPAPGATTDDPCSPADGSTPPSGCPLGVTGIVPITDPIPLSYVNAFPYPARTSHLFDATCGALPPVAGLVPVGIVSGAPIDATITFWPSSDPSTTRTVPYSTSAGDRLTFANAETTAHTPADLPQQTGCVFLRVDSSTAYTAQLTGSDSLMRPITPVTFLFNGAGTPVHPELEAHAVGGNLLFLSALHAPSERVEFHLVDANAPSPTCDSAVLPGVSAESSGNTTVTADDLNALGVVDGNTVRTTAAYFLPEGSAMLLCARWFPTVGHSWDLARATWQSLQFAQSPSILSPNLNLDSVTGPGLAGMTISVSSGAGTVCGSPVVWDPADPTRVSGRVMAASLCFPELYGGAHFDGSRFWSLALDPNLVVFISARTSHGTINVTRAIDAEARPCTGLCPLPAPAPFVIPITDDGSSSIHLTLSYTGGPENSVGRTTWSMGQVGGAAADATPPDFPQLDTEQAVTARIQTGTLVQPYPLAAVVTVPLTIDRPVDYRIQLVQDGSATACVRPSPYATAIVTGHLAVSATIDIPYMCLGTNYAANVTLTDAAGHRSVWGQTIGDPTHYWGGNSLVQTPTLTGTLHYQFRPRDGGRMDWANVLVANQHIDQISTDFAGYCRGDELYDSQGNVPNVHIGQVIGVDVNYGRSELPYNGAGFCTLASATNDEVVGSQAVTIDQLLASPDGVILTDPKWTLQINIALNR